MFIRINSPRKHPAATIAQDEQGTRSYECDSYDFTGPILIMRNAASRWYSMGSWATDRERKKIIAIHLSPYDEVVIN